MPDHLWSDLKMDSAQFDFLLQLDTAKLQEFLAKLCRSLEESREREKELATALEQVLKRQQQGEQDAEEQRQAMQKLQGEVSGISKRCEDLEKLKLPEKAERFDNHHNECRNLQAQLAQLEAKLKSEEAAISHAEGRSVAVEERQNALEEGFQELLTEFSLVKNSQRTVCGQCEQVEARCFEVERRQDELSSSVQNKYDTLWRSVEQSLENISTAELKRYHRDIQAVSGEIEKRTSAQISYCLDILARATVTNRSRDLKRAVIVRWREQAWLASRRKLGLVQLTRAIHAQMRTCFRRWLHHVRWNCEVERVKGECESMIPDFHALLAGAVNPRLQSLEQGVECEARKTDLLVERNRELWQHLQAVTGTSFQVTCADKQVTCELENHARFRQNAEQRVRDAEGTVAQLSEQLSLVAREDDVKSMMKDILLIWTSVKQLDAVKADRKEVDNLGAEVHNSCQTSSSGDALQENTVEHRLASLQSALEQSTAKYKEFEFMLGLVVKLLEEIANTQLATMQQTRRVPGPRLGCSRLESRFNCRATPRQAYEVVDLSNELMQSARSLHTAQQSGVAELDRGEKACPSPNSRSVHEEKPAGKNAQPSTEPQAGPDTAGKDGPRSPSVAAFADWVDSVRKTIEMKRGPGAGSMASRSWIQSRPPTASRLRQPSARGTAPLCPEKLH
ncbi:hypothetical protein Efla_005729 [Eimeria flavescens]